MSIKLPSITVIIPTYNEGKGLSSCLTSIKSQDYPQSKIQILIVDDYSSDNTVKISKKYQAKVIFSGRKDCQASRAIGLKKAKGELILMLDADNQLPTSDWIRKAVEPFLENENLVGSQPAKYYYRQTDHPANRYCSLFGVTQPFPYYLNKRGFMKLTESKWMYRDTLIKETNNYFLVRFSISNLPTMGCQGFLVKRKLLGKNYGPRFFHMDAVYDLVKGGYDLFAITKTSISHDYVMSYRDFFSKLRKYMWNFLVFRGVRKYKYQTNYWQPIKAVLMMTTLIVPTLESISGFRKKRDWAWFLHPVFCLYSCYLGLLVVAKWGFKYFVKGNENH